MKYELKPWQPLKIGNHRNGQAIEWTKIMKLGDYQACKCTLKPPKEDKLREMADSGDIKTHNRQTMVLILDGNSEHVR